jgi:hypothetical protein
MDYSRRTLLAILPGLFVGLTWAADKISPAENALFMTDHLAALSAPTSVHYRFRKSGTLETGFDDAVSLTLSAPPGARCCRAHTEFLSGSRRIQLPDIAATQGNPVILHFLERDIHEMQRLTGGKPNYFRQRIRMALFQAASIRPLSVTYQGRSVPAQAYWIAPYRGDPLQERLKTLVNKTYVFTLSDKVPGALVSIRTEVAGQADAPLLREEVLLAGATISEPAFTSRTKPP